MPLLFSFLNINFPLILARGISNLTVIRERIVTVSFGQPLPSMNQRSNLQPTTINENSSDIYLRENVYNMTFILFVIHCYGH